MPKPLKNNVKISGILLALGLSLGAILNQNNFATNIKTQLLDETITEEPIVAIEEEPIVAIEEEPIVATEEEPIVAIEEEPIQLSWNPEETNSLEWQKLPEIEFRLENNNNEIVIADNIDQKLVGDLRITLAELQTQNHGNLYLRFTPYTEKRSFATISLNNLWVVIDNLIQEGIILNDEKWFKIDLQNENIGPLLIKLNFPANMPPGVYKTTSQFILTQ